MITEQPSPPAIVASVLTADFAQLDRELQAVEVAGADRVQWDVMDGRFVPNLPLGPDIIRRARNHTTLPFEAHLMMEDPDWSLHQWVDAGCQTVIVHVEAVRHLQRTLAEIRRLGAAAGVALNPATSLEAIRHVVDDIDLLLIMSVNPGFGGQSYLPAMTSKIGAARRMLDRAGSAADLEVDGGINLHTISTVTTAGVSAAVVGSALFGHRSDMGSAVTELRAAAGHWAMTR